MENVFKRHKLLTITLASLLLLTLLVMVFFDPLVKKAGNHFANKVQDDFDVRIESVNSQLFALKTNIEMNVVDRKTGDKIVDVKDITLDVNLRPSLLDIAVSDVDITINKELLTRLMASENKEATSEKKDPPDILKFIQEFSLSNFNLTYSDTDNQLIAQILALDLNFSEGTGSINGISSRLRDFKQRLLDINEIDLQFQTKGLMGEESAELGVTIEGSQVALAQKALSALKSLMEFPEKSEPKTAQSPLSELSFIKFLNLDITLADQKIKSGVDLLAVDFEKGKVQAQNFKGNWTSTGRKLIQVDEVSVSFSPDEIMSTEKPDLSLIISGLDFYVGKELKSLSKPEKTPKTKTELPVSISKILVGTSRVHLLDVPGVGQQKYLQLGSIFGNINHITMEAGTPLANFNFNASLGGDSALMANGKLDLAHTPPQFSVDYRVFDLDMRKLNPELRERLPLTFKEGEFDLLGEIIKHDEKIVGYFKPFLEDAQYLGNQREFKNPKHFFVEIGATITNWLLENKETETVAAKVPFVIENGNIDFKAGQALWSAIENGLLENKEVEKQADQYQLKQAQEVDPDADGGDND